MLFNILKIRVNIILIELVYGAFKMRFIVDFTYMLLICM